MDHRLWLIFNKTKIQKEKKIIKNHNFLLNSNVCDFYNFALDLLRLKVRHFKQFIKPDKSATVSVLSLHFVSPDLSLQRSWFYFKLTWQQLSLADDPVWCPNSVLWMPNPKNAKIQTLLLMQQVCAIIWPSLSLDKQLCRIKQL